MAEIIPVAADHAGYEMKQRVVEELRRLGYEPLDLGTHSSESTDYPPYAHDVAERVQNGSARRAVLLCGTGLGMAYAANRHKGVRAAVVWNDEVTRLSREHNDANVLVLPSRCIGDDEAVRMLHTFLDTPFDGGRHIRRVEGIDAEGGA